jgi:hypothetical protein
MGVTYSRNFNTFPRDIESRYRRLRADIQAAMREAMDEGAKLGKAIIEVSGTAKSGKRGRIETGAMRDAFDGDVKVSSRDIEGRLGWINEFMDYFGYQGESGFRHAISGEFIEGVRALSLASDRTWDMFTERCDQAVRRFNRG